MKQVHFCGKVRIIGKGAERVDCGMYDDTGQQTSAAIKYRDQQESNRNRKNDLTQVIHKIHTAAVEKVDNMSDAESYARDDNGGFAMPPHSRFTIVATGIGAILVTSRVRTRRLAILLW